MSKKVNLAAVLESPRGDFQLRATDIPSPGPGEILIKVARIALNQIDKRVALHAAFPLPYPAILGACIAGRVEAVGTSGQDKDSHVEGISAAAFPDVPQSATAPASPPLLPRFAVGDRVATYTSYYSRKDHKDNRFGAFQNYVLCNESTVLKLNDSDDLSSGASIIANAPLAAVALSHFVGIPLSVEKDVDIIAPPAVDEQQRQKCQQQQKQHKLLCYGAATGLGGFVTQLAAQNGHQVICTAKTANHKYIRRLGAHKVFDYTDTANIEQQLADEGPYDAIIDCISTQQTIQLLDRAVQNCEAREATIFTNNNKCKRGDPPVIYTLLPFSPSEQNDKASTNNSNHQKSCPTKFMWLTAPFGMEHKREFTRWLFWNVLQSHLDSKTLVATPPLLVKGGLKALREAMDRMGTVSAQKVVVSLDE